MKRISATIYFPEGEQYHTYVWLNNDATEDEIISVLRREALDIIEFDYTEEVVN